MYLNTSYIEEMDSYCPDVISVYITATTVYLNTSYIEEIDSCCPDVVSVYFTKLILSTVMLVLLKKGKILLVVYSSASTP